MQWLAIDVSGAVCVVAVVIVLVSRAVDTFRLAIDPTVLDMWKFTETVGLVALCLGMAALLLSI